MCPTGSLIHIPNIRLLWLYFSRYLLTVCHMLGWILLGENGSLKDKERRKNCLCLWKRKEDEGWWDVSSLTPQIFRKILDYHKKLLRSRARADTSSVGTRNAGWGVGRNEGRGHLSLSHVRALDSAPVQLARVCSSRLMRVKKKCWGSRFSEAERWRWTGGTDLCTLQVCWRNGRSSGAREVWEESSFSK